MVWLLHHMIDVVVTDPWWQRWWRWWWWCAVNVSHVVWFLHHMIDVVVTDPWWRGTTSCQAVAAAVSSDPEWCPDRVGITRGTCTPLWCQRATDHLLWWKGTSCVWSIWRSVCVHLEVNVWIIHNKLYFHSAIVHSLPATDSNVFCSDFLFIHHPSDSWLDVVHANVCLFVTNTTENGCCCRHKTFRAEDRNGS